MALDNKRYKELVFDTCFLCWPGPRIGGLGSTVGRVSLLTIHTQGAKPVLAKPSRCSWIFSRFFLNEAFSERPRGPEESWGSFHSSSELQDVQLVTCGQGRRDPCVLSLPLATGPTGEPSLPVMRLSTGEQSKNKIVSLRLFSMNVPLPFMGNGMSH